MPGSVVPLAMFLTPYLLGVLSEDLSLLFQLFWNSFSTLLVKICLNFPQPLLLIFSKLFKWEDGKAVSINTLRYIQDHFISAPLQWRGKQWKFKEIRSKCSIPGDTLSDILKDCQFRIQEIDKPVWFFLGQYFFYDKVSANTASWFPKTSEIQSGHKKKVLNT